MNSTVRTLLVLVALIVAIVIASSVYRRTADPARAQSPVHAATRNESQVHPELQAALGALREQRNEDALAHFQAVPADSPDYTAARLRYAVELAKGGKLLEAQTSLYQLSQRFPDDAEIQALLGWLFFLAQDYERAERTALRTLEIAPDHLATRYNVALYRVALGQTQPAVRSYVRAIRADPAGHEVALHRERLREFHERHTDLPATHYALAFLANATQDRRTEVEELEHFLLLVDSGVEADGARARLAEARKALGG